MHDGVWVFSEILPLTVPYTDARTSSSLSRVCCSVLERSFLERSAERALNLGITGAFWYTFGSLRTSPLCESGFHLIACKCSGSSSLSSGSSQSSPLCFHMIVPIAWSYFETTGAIGATWAIKWKPGKKELRKNNNSNNNNSIRLYKLTSSLQSVTWQCTASFVYN